MLRFRDGFRPGRRLRSVGGRSRRSEPGAAPRGGGGARARVHPRGRRLGQDDDDHAPDRVAGRFGRVPGRRDPRRHVHGQGGRRDEGAACGARRRRRRGAHLPLGGARAASPLLARRGRADPGRRRRWLLRQIANALPRPYRFRPAGDLATEVERAKNLRVAPERYLAALGEHDPPIPADLMATVFREYERRKASRGELDFEDVLELAVRLYESDEHARADVRERYRAFTVDEYQDVNLLQQALLDQWLGAARRPLRRRRRLPVDLRVHRRVARAGCSACGSASRTRPSCASRRTTARRRRCSSSRTGSCRGSAAPRRCCAPTRPAGPEPVARSFVTAESEDAWLAHELKRLAREGVPLEEVAILCRTNARLADFEEVLHEAGLPFQGSSLLGREAARRLLRLLEGDGSTDVAGRVRALAEEAGWLAEPPDRLGERELTRQADLGRLVRLAEELDDGERTCGEFVGGAAAAVRSRRRLRPRRSPAHVPPREGARVRRRLPAAARGQGAARRSSRGRPTSGPRSVGSSTSG